MEKIKIMKKIIYSILTLGFLVSCSSGGSDNPQPLSEQLIIGTWEISETSSDIEIYTEENGVRNTLLDSNINFDRVQLIELYDGVLPIWRFDDNGSGTNSEGESFLWSLSGDQYLLEDCTGVYSGIFSIDSERLILNDLGGEYLEYDSINQWWESQYIDFTFNKINNPSGKLNRSYKNIDEFISKSLER